MKTLETLYQYVFIASAVSVRLYPIRAYWRIYGLYKCAGEQIKKIGFFWFSFYVQSPDFGRGASVLEALSRDIQARASTIRSQQTREASAILAWIVFLIVLGTLLGRLSPR
ncbi:hypothetical protein ABIB94_008758 [Bradyrhizobium sp. JR7.2]|uniref:hypothetical protein n=1 Tax=unclassified Bradyrhizobium TaxID=2631580 RepID=UPI003392BCD1